MAGANFQIVEVPGMGEVEFPADMTDDQIAAAIRKNSMGIKQAPSNTSKVASWTNQALAAIPDALLNTPANVINLAKAGFGAAAAAAGREDLAPNITPAPSYITRAMTQAGLINPDAEPTSVGGKLAKAGVQGAVGGMIAPAASLPQMVANMGVNSISSVVGTGTEQATGSPALGIAAGMATVPALSAGLNAARENAIAARDRNAVRDATLRAGREAGYVAPPSTFSDSWINRRLESIAGKAAVSQEAAARNQEITNQAGREAAGLPQNQAISEAALVARRNALGQPYREARAIDPAVNQMVDDLNTARADARDYWRVYQTQNARPENRNAAIAADQRVAALEAQIEAAARNAGNAGLVDRLRQARIDIARVHEVDRALNVGTGDVSAPVLGRARDRGAPLTGGLRVAGDMQQAFPSAMREGATIPTPGVSKSEALASSLLGLGGFTATGNPLGFAFGALPLLSGPVRSLLLSNSYQNFMMPSYRAANLPQLNDPALRALLQGETQGVLAQ